MINGPTSAPQASAPPHPGSGARSLPRAPFLEDGGAPDANAEQTRSLLAAIVESSADAIISKDLSGIIRSWNHSAERIFGYAAGEIIGRPIAPLIPPERRDEEAEILRRVGYGERIDWFETQRLTRDGRRIEVSTSISPVRGADGRIVGASGVLRDIGQQKRVEAELREHRDRLEEAVRARAAELEESHQRLRVSERMAALGTLSAGIGHDMGNLLLPLRIRLDALERTALTPERKEDVAAIRSCAEYLQRLAGSLRLLATGANDDAAGGSTALHEWWTVAEPMLRTCLPKAVRFEADIDPGAPRVALPAHELTQLAFNLVQNAGHACAGRPDPLVTIEARADGPDRVAIAVADNGAGMSDEVRRRCREPFFTTRTRAVSTGLGLSLVAGIVDRAGGRMDIDSAPDLGARFSLSLPAAFAEVAPPRDAGAAWLTIADPHLRAFVRATLGAMHVRAAFGATDPAAWLLVTDASGSTGADTDRFLAANPARIALAIGGKPRDRVAAVDPDAGVAVVREALREAIASRGAG